MELLGRRLLAADKTWKLWILAAPATVIFLFCTFLLLTSSISRNYYRRIGTNYYSPSSNSSHDYSSPTPASPSFAGGENTTRRTELQPTGMLLSNKSTPTAGLEANISSSAAGLTASREIMKPPAAATKTSYLVSSTTTSAAAAAATSHAQNMEKKKTKTTKRICDMSDGKWVFKPEQKPAYDEQRCPFVEEKMNCRKNRRPDLDYEKWSWEATNCHIPMFNGGDILKRLRGKRVIIVGDSLNRNQWESLACLLYASVRRKSRVFVNSKYPEYKVFKAKDYRCMVEFYWSPFIVDHQEFSHPSGSRVVVLDKLPPSSKKWKGADIMVFNTGHWWTHRGKVKSWDFFEYQKKLVKDMPIELAYETALRTWSAWIDTYVNPNKTTVFFRSISSEHRKKNWCFNATDPITDENSYTQLFPTSLIQIVKDQIKRMRNPVRFLNVTKLSEYRVDAHPSIYRTRNNWKLVSMITDGNEYERFVRGSSDCSHWCLPGVPDTWNRLLFASLSLNTSSSDFSS